MPPDQSHGGNRNHSGEHDPWRDHAMARLDEIAKDLRELARDFRLELAAGGHRQADQERRIALLEQKNDIGERSNESAKVRNLGLMTILAMGITGAAELIRFLVALGHAATSLPPH